MLFYDEFLMIMKLNKLTIIKLKFYKFSEIPNKDFKVASNKFKILIL